MTVIRGEPLGAGHRPPTSSGRVSRRDAENAKKREDLVRRITQGLDERESHPRLSSLRSLWAFAALRETLRLFRTDT